MVGNNLREDLIVTSLVSLVLSLRLRDLSIRSGSVLVQTLHLSIFLV